MSLATWEFVPVAMIWDLLEITPKDPLVIAQMENTSCGLMESLIACHNPLLLQFLHRFRLERVELTQIAILLLLILNSFLVSITHVFVILIEDLLEMRPLPLFVHVH